MLQDLLQLNFTKTSPIQSIFKVIFKEKWSELVQNTFSDSADPKDYPSKTSLHEKMKFSIKDFFSKYDQIRSFLRILSHLLKKSFMENFIFCASFHAIWLFAANSARI